MMKKCLIFQLIFILFSCETLECYHLATPSASEYSFKNILDVPDSWHPDIKKSFRKGKTGILELIILSSDEELSKQAMEALELMLLEDRYVTKITTTLKTIIGQKPSHITQSTFKALVHCIQNKTISPAYRKINDRDNSSLTLRNTLSVLTRVIRDHPAWIDDSLVNTAVTVINNSNRKKSKIMENALYLLYVVSYNKPTLLDVAAVLCLRKIFFTEGLSGTCYHHAYSSLKNIDTMNSTLTQPNEFINFIISQPEHIVYHSFVHYPVYLSPSFDELTSDFSDVAKYSIALVTYRLLKRFKIPLSESNIRKALIYIVAKREELINYDLFADGINVINIINTGHKFHHQALEKLEKSAWIKSIASFTGRRAKQEALKSIAESKGPLFIYIYGHGHGGYFTIDSGFTSHDRVTCQEIGNALIKRGALSNVIISTCYSYNIAIQLYNYLERKKAPEMPLIVSSSNYYRESYFKFFPALKKAQTSHLRNPVITIGDIFDAEEHAFQDQDFAVFVPFNSAEITKLFNIRLPIEHGKRVPLYLRLPSRVLEAGLSGAQDEIDFHEGTDGQEQVKMENVETLITAVAPLIDDFSLPSESTSRTISFIIKNRQHYITAKIDYSLNALFKISNESSYITVNPLYIEDDFGRSVEYDIVLKTIFIHEIADCLGKKLGFNHNTRHTASKTLEALYAQK